MRIIKPAVILLTLAVGGWSAGCGQREETVRVYDAPKDPAATTQPILAAAATPGTMTPDAMPPGATTPPPAATSPPAMPQNDRPTLTWTVPQGWKEIPGSGMRVATLVANEDPKLELTVIPLEGGAGALLPNVNRWENQLGLPPTPQEKLNDIVKTSKVNGLEVQTVDLTGPESQKPRLRMLAAIVPFNGRFWFFKMAGPADAIGAQNAKFDALIQSLKPGAGGPGANAGAAAGQLPAGHAPVGGGAPGQLPAGHPQIAGGAPATAPAAVNVKLAKWTAPDDWKEIPGSTLPRVIAFQVGPADQNAQLVATRFAPDNAGSFQDNINRWRGQIGLPPAEDAQRTTPMADLPLGKNDQGLMLEFDNPQNKKHMLVILGQPGGGDLYFFKLGGPTDLVTAQKAKFQDFVKSLEFAPEK